MTRRCTMARSVLNAIVAHARTAAPAECCGVLVGSEGTVFDAVPARNLSDRPATRYVLDPRTHFETQRHARARQLAVVGFYHSHPASDPEPSETDVAEAAYPGALYLIVGLAQAHPRVRAFAFVDGRLEESTIVSFPP